MLLLVLTKNDYVIDVDQAAHAQKWPEHLIEDSLEVGRGIS